VVKLPLLEFRISANMTADAQYKQRLEKLAREWKEEAATATRKSS
jgi:hypothetical protein